MLSSSMYLLAVASMVCEFYDPTQTHGAIQGKVSSVQVQQEHPDRFNVYFSQVGHDKWGCLKGKGFVTITRSTDDTQESFYQQAFLLSITAQTTGQSLVLDTNESHDCDNFNAVLLAK